MQVGKLFWFVKRKRLVDGGGGVGVFILAIFVKLPHRPPLTARADW